MINFYIFELEVAVEPEPEMEPEPEPDLISTAVQVLPEVTTVGVQVLPEVTTVGVQMPEVSLHDAGSTVVKLVEMAHQFGMAHNFSSLASFISCARLSFQSSGPPLQIHNSNCSWNQYYAVLSFLLNGHLFARYDALSMWLGLPSCSNRQWHRIVEKLEVHVSKLAEWSCGQVRQAVIERGDEKKWIASYDGFYLTRGHYSNNSSATLHDFFSGDIAWFTHRTKRGAGHNWEGTSGGAEGDMFDEVLGAAKAAGFTVKEIVTDKDSSMNAIYCRHYPEGTITYCSNHCAKTLHKDLQKVKQNKCEVSM